MHAMHIRAGHTDERPASGMIYDWLAEQDPIKYVFICCWTFLQEYPFGHASEHPGRCTTIFAAQFAICPALGRNL